VQHAPPRFLHHPGVPHIHFSSYTRNQSIHILSNEPLDIFEDNFPDDMDYDDETHTEDKDWLWPRFCAAVWDSLAQSCARDLASFRDVCHKIWRPFVAPIHKGDFGTRDFSRLLVAQRKLFQDEAVLSDSIISTSTERTTTIKSKSNDLPYYAKYIILAAYLASSNPARLDQIYFMKSSERKRRKKGGGTARSGGGKPSQNRKLPRHLLAPTPFPLDRLLSILYAILPHDFRSTIDIYAQIATLASLRLLVRAGGIGGSDALEAGGKWKVGPAVSWEYVQGLAQTLDFALLDYVAE
jgi:origin recognition complex subunit 5